ncbi:MAG: CaiB/BaiF CoA-transferase family protein [Actinomycetota bacterium]|nr:CaiB/BaiF CoA-transferase family protein [Actinomycetota bacterium]
MIKLLEGVRVVECAVLFNGDQTSRLLGDLGATVIKVEAPGVGDYLRDFLGQITPHHSPAHMYVNRNKRSMTLNLRSEEGRAIFFDLIRTADIFVDGFAGDACTRLGIGYEEQRAIKPDIIYAQCSGFGASGPYAMIPTHGQMMGALGGGVSLAMGEDGLVKELGGLGDGTAVGATNTALTAVAALIQRNRTGEGAYIDGAGSDAVLATQWFHATYQWNDARLTDRRGMVQSGPSAKYHFYETSDKKFVLFCAIEPKFWANFCSAVGRPDLLATADENAPVDFGSGAGGTNLAHVLQSIFHTRTKAEWIALALEADIALGPANQVGDLQEDPHLRSRGIIHESVHPHAGPFTSVGWAAPVQGQPFSIGHPAPLLGEHTDEVLAQLGRSDAEIARLRAEGVV